MAKSLSWHVSRMLNKTRKWIVIRECNGTQIDWNVLWYFLSGHNISQSFHDKLDAQLSNPIAKWASIPCRLFATRGLFPSHYIRLCNCLRPFGSLMSFQTRNYSLSYFLSLLKTSLSRMFLSILVSLLPPFCDSVYFFVYRVELKHMFILFTGF